MHGVVAANPTRRYTSIGKDVCEITYTQNWPPEGLIGNRPTGSIVVRDSPEQVVALFGGAHVAHAAWHLLDRDRVAGLMDRLRWLRVIGDTIFAAGAVGLGWFVLGLKTGWSLEPRQPGR